MICIKKYLKIILINTQQAKQQLKNEKKKQTKNRIYTTEN